jgi:hypothetical protein
MADPESVKGISPAAQEYNLIVSQHKDHWLFVFRDEEGHSGHLTFVMPSSVSVFEIDPREVAKEGRNGALLYKEWKLTTNAAGSGIFSQGVGGGQHMTLILQGHGNSCTSAEDFSHWTLVVHGPRAEYSFFGDLVSPAPADPARR